MSLIKSKSIFALVDCNNFYASCEKVFNLSIRKKPIVVLSNNDGCAVARSSEAKALGIKMGEPYFKWKYLQKTHDVQVFSSNYVLYGDMSHRVMKTLEQFAPEQEVYSIDEAFLKLEQVAEAIKDLNSYGQKIKYTVTRNTGIPVSVGIASTKTLSKIANHFVKRNSSYDGVLCLNERNIDSFLKQIQVEDIWGIGAKRAQFLHNNGIDTAYQFKNADDLWIKKNLTICGLRTAWELRGISCLSLEEKVADKKAIVVSRSFGQEVSSFDELLAATSTFISKAVEKVRRQGSKTGYMQIFVNSNRFKKNVRYYSNAVGVNLDSPTDDTATLLNLGRKLLKVIYKDDVSYKKSGVLFTEFSSRNEVQLDLTRDDAMFLKRQKLMSIIDSFNKANNFGKIQFAQEGLRKKRNIKQEYKSKRFTTSWDELLVV